MSHNQRDLSAGGWEAEPLTAGVPAGEASASPESGGEPRASATVARGEQPTAEEGDPAQVPSSDVAILDLLRKRQSMTVSELAKALGVTATAVRQRLTRLLGQELIGRISHRQGRGRPSHRYQLTSKGQRQAGHNFGDLALVLWEEMRAIGDPEVRRGLLTRLARRLAEQYSDQIEGNSISEKMASAAELFRKRRIPLEVGQSDGLPILNVLACPYPELAEQDRAICAVEKQMFSELFGGDVRLSDCRLDGGTCCTFEMRR